MFNKIFTYSSIDKKENRITGIIDIIKWILFLFPAAGLGMGLFSCYIMYISDNMYRKIYYVIAAILMSAIFVFIFKWLKEMFVVYAIGKNGKFYRFKMFAFAVGYMGLGSKIRETAGKGMGRLQGTFEIMMKIKKTIEGLDNEEQIDAMFAQGYVAELSDIKVKKQNSNSIKFSALCAGSEDKKNINISIRKVYNDWENLFNYIEFISDNPNKSGTDFKFLNKTSYEDFVVKKPSYINRVLKQSLWVMIIAAWLGMFTLSSDINKQSKINAGMYIGTTADVLNIDDSKSRRNVFIIYDVDGREYKTDFATDSNKYKVGDEFELFYQKGNPEKYFIFAFEQHINYKSVLVLVLLFEAVILAVNIDFKRKS